MDDLISRQAAIEVVKKYFEAYLEANPDICLDGIRSLPSAKPKDQKKTRPRKRLSEEELREHARERWHRYYESHKEELRQKYKIKNERFKEYQKEWYQQSKERIMKKQKERYRSDYEYREKRQAKAREYYWKRKMRIIDELKREGKL